MEFKYIKGMEIKRNTNLVITDVCYLEGVESIFTVDVDDGLYNMFKDDDNVMGTVGVDSARIGIFKKKDIPKEQFKKLKSNLYTEILNFKGEINFYSRDEFVCEYEGEKMYRTYNILAFSGDSKDKKIECFLEC